MLRITYFRNKCIGCNGCVEAAPDRWRVSRKDGRCTLIGGTEKGGIYHAIVGLEEHEQNQMAAANCPVNIIKLQVI